MALVSPQLLLQTVFLLGLVATGGALMCHESTCLDDEQLTSCAFTNDTVLKECDVEVFRDASRRMRQPLHRIVTNLPMTCIKIEEEGFIDGEKQTGVIRMCYLDLPQICSSLQRDATEMVEQHSQPLAIRCSTCNSDGCNTAPRGARCSAALLAAASAITLLVAASSL